MPPITLHPRMMAFKNGGVRETTPFLLTMFELALEMKPDVILEIGLHNAISAHAWLSALQNNGKGMLHGVDILDFSNNVKDPELLKHFTFHKADSSEFYKTWDTPIDILHIDGNHKYSFVKSDYENYYPFVRPGGYIFLHDLIHWRDVTRYWDEIQDEKVALPFYDGMGIIRKKGLEPKDIAATRKSLAG